MMKNYLIENNVPDFIKERNKKLLDAYNFICVIISKIISLLEDEKLRILIESDFRQDPNSEATMFQCTTLFCIVSLGCDNKGSYNLVYSLDYRIKEMITLQMANTLIRRIYEFTEGDLDTSAWFGSLCENCVEEFLKLMEEAETKNYHKVIENPIKK